GCGAVTNFTPPFPSYDSGHASFGSALFQVLREYYGTDNIPFSFQSDEFNGVTTDDTGAVRPPVTRSYNNLTEPEIENHDSRIYLGIHWRFDQDQGLIMGRSVGDYVFDHVLRPVGGAVAEADPADPTAPDATQALVTAVGIS